MAASRVESNPRPEAPMRCDTSTMKGLVSGDPFVFPMLVVFPLPIVILVQIRLVGNDSSGCGSDV